MIKRGPAAPLERTIVNNILIYLRERGAFAEKVHGDAVQSSLLDIIACYRGVFLHLEAKRPGGKLTKRQEYIIQKVQDAGGRACKVESVDDVARVLDDIDRWVY